MQESAQAAESLVKSRAKELGIKTDFSAADTHLQVRGDVLPIGGLSEKTLAALAAGIKKVLILRGNEKDIPELPLEVRESLTVVPVDTVDNVIELMLVA